MTAKPNQHWGTENQTSVSRFVMRIVAHLCLMTMILPPLSNFFGDFKFQRKRQGYFPSVFQNSTCDAFLKNKM